MNWSDECWVKFEAHDSEMMFSVISPTLRRAGSFEVGSLFHEYRNNQRASHSMQVRYSLNVPNWKRRNFYRPSEMPEIVTRSCEILTQQQLF
jgi:hypothetical protein